MSPEPVYKEEKPTHKPDDTSTREIGTHQSVPHPTSGLKISPNKRSRNNYRDIDSTPKMDRETKRRAVSHQGPEVIELDGKDEIREFNQRMMF